MINLKKKNPKKKMVLGFIFLSLMISLSACTESSDSIQQDQQEQILKEGTSQVGMPNIKNFNERKWMKTILEKRDNPDLTTYVYTEANDGRFVYIGRAIGYGLPYSTEFTNPEKYQGNAVTLPQADPNGLFAPNSSEATWVMLINEKTNQPEVQYMEPRAFITESKLPVRLLEPWSVPSDY